MEGEPVYEEVMDLETIQLLFILKQFHGKSLPFFGDETDRRPLLKHTDLRKNNLNLPIHLINGTKLHQEPTKKFLSLALGELRLLIFNDVSLDDLHLVEYYFLAQVAFAPLVVDLMLDFVLRAACWRVVFDVAQHCGGFPLILLLFLLGFIHGMGCMIK